MGGIPNFHLNAVGGRMQHLCDMVFDISLTDEWYLETWQRPRKIRKKMLSAIKVEKKSYWQRKINRNRRN
jgi:hypothetical protein